MEPKAPLARCDECPLRDQPFVPPEGPSRADRVVVGQAPGAKEVEAGRPFVGPAGEVLNRELGPERLTVYVTNTVLCCPQRNKKPSIRAVCACHDRLIQELKGRRPKKVLVLGEVASSALLDDFSATIADLRDNNPHRCTLLGNDVQVFGTYHPAAVLRNPNLEPMLATDIRRLLDP